MFDVNLYDIVTITVPPHKRTMKLIAFLHVLISPLITLYNTFKSYRTSVLYQIRYDGSTIHLEKFLNDEFNDGIPGIIIETNITENYLFISDKEYAEDVYIPDKAFSGDPVYCADPVYFNSQYDFTVKVPAALLATLDLNKFQSFINDYRMAGKTYNVISL